MVTPVRASHLSHPPRRNIRLLPPVESFEHPVESAQFLPLDQEACQGKTAAHEERDAIIACVVVTVCAIVIATLGMLAIVYYVLGAR
jgi:DhnA family fructose-bisphosphate aldolase class Ia